MGEGAYWEHVGRMRRVLRSTQGLQVQIDRVPGSKTRVLRERRISMMELDECLLNLSSSKPSPVTPVPLDNPKP